MVMSLWHLRQCHYGVPANLIIIMTYTTLCEEVRVNQRESDGEEKRVTVNIVLGQKTLRSISNSQIKRTSHRMTGGIFNLIKVSGHLIPLQARKLIIEGSGSSHRHEEEERKEQVTDEM